MVVLQNGYLKLNQHVVCVRRQDSMLDRIQLTLRNMYLLDRNQ